TCVAPASFPKPLPTKIAPGTFSRYRLPACGRTAVTPVRMLSPRIMVVCPTSTPATSVIASSGPVGRMPTFNPRSDTRGRVVWAAARAVSDESTSAARNFLSMGTSIQAKSSFVTHSQHLGKIPVVSAPGWVSTLFPRIGRGRNSRYSNDLWCGFAAPAEPEARRSSDIRHSLGIKAREACTAGATDTGVDDTSGAALQQLFSQRLRRHV